MTLEEQANAILWRLHDGLLTPDAAEQELIQAGVGPCHAGEMVLITLGGSDVVEVDSAEEADRISDSGQMHIPTVPVYAKRNRMPKPGAR